MVSDPSNDKNIWLAASEGNNERVQHLVEKCGVDVNSLDENSYSPIHAAVSYSHFELLDYLLSKGGDVNLLDDDGESPLFVVEDVEMAKHIVEKYHADTHLRNNDGITPLEKLIDEDEHEEVQEYLKTVSPEPSNNTANISGDDFENTETGRQVAEIMRQAEQDGVDPEERLRELVTQSLLGQQE
ncbi:ankyrin [Wallemia mellicola]|nr:ankyrin [Wallemia mellicola]